MGFQTEEELPQLEPALQPRMDADEDIPSCRNKKDNYGPQKRAGSDSTFPVGNIQNFSTDRSRSRRRHGPEVIQIFPVGNIQNFSTDRSRSRCRHGPEVIQTFPAGNIQNFSADRSRSR